MSFRKDTYDSNDNTEGLYNAYFLTANILIRENDKFLDTEAMKDYFNNKFSTDKEKKLIEGTISESLDHKNIDNRSTPKRNSYFFI